MPFLSAENPRETYSFQVVVNILNNINPAAFNILFNYNIVPLRGRGGGGRGFSGPNAVKRDEPICRRSLKSVVTDFKFLTNKHGSTHIPRLF